MAQEFEEAQTAVPNRDAAGGYPPGAFSADLELVQAIVMKRADRLTALVDRLACIPRILAARNQDLGRPLNDSDLDELAQDALAVVWRKLPTFEGRSSLETWVYRIADFELRNRVRRKLFRRQREAPVEVLQGLAGSGDEDFGEDYSDLHAALEQLPAEERSVLRAKHYDDLSFSDLATQLGISEGTAKGRYYRGLERLQFLLRNRRNDYQ
jgi:RNA polymerase sigma-70 factor (ECF subfamily)